ncbi:MAG: hypothetical protein ACMUIM_03905 [bacterium]
MKICIKVLIILLFFVFIFPQRALAKGEYDFDLTEIEKRPYRIGGYFELRPLVFGLDRDASLYKIKFYDRDEGKTLWEYNVKFQLDGSYEWKKAGIYIKTNSDLKKSYLGRSDKTSLYEGYLSIKPSFSFSMDIGKMQLKWGKGYAWNPVAFVDRPKDPDDPEIGLEGFIVAKAEYIKSFKGPLKSLALTPVLIPVTRDVNEDFGIVDHTNFAFKAYFLLYNTDIDLIAFRGQSKGDRYGFDFSRNIRSNFEVHGEWAYIDDSKTQFIDSNGQILERISDTGSYLVGIRYLTASDTTYIFEYYHNGTGFYEHEVRDYFSFINKGYATYLLSGDDTSIEKAYTLTEGNYGRMNPMRDYFYLRISQKEPFDILYLIPSIGMIYNTTDSSFSLSPELLYSPITNLELRLKGGFLSGRCLSEFGEKQNDYKIEFRCRYYY